MQITQYNKLVRDKIPAMLAERDISTVTKRARDEEMPDLLEAKLCEEFQELTEASELNKIYELVDLITVGREWLIRHNPLPSTDPTEILKEGMITLNLIQVSEVLGNLVAVISRSDKNPAMALRQVKELLAVAEAYGNKLGYSTDEIEQLIREKESSRGAFKMNVVLISTIENENSHQ